MRSCYLYSAKKCLSLILVLLLSGCSTYSQYKPYHPLSIESQNKLQPHYVAVNHGQLEYYQLGHGSPIVLITGYAMDISSWNRQFLATLAEKHRVIVFNNRNVGKSFIHSIHYEAIDLANDTYQLIQNLHLKKPAVLGISMGGIIAQQLAVIHPDKLGQLILINTVIAGKQAVHPEARTEEKIWNMPTHNVGRFVAGLNLFFPPASRWQMGVALLRDRFQPKTYTEIKPAIVMPQQRRLVMHWVSDDATAKRIAHLALPVLILNGEADSVIPPVNSIILARTIPHSELIRWNEGGHAMIYQYPVNLADAVNAFLNKCASLT